MVQNLSKNISNSNLDSFEENNISNKTMTDTEIKEYVAAELLKFKAEMIVELMLRTPYSTDEGKINRHSHKRALEDGLYKEIISGYIAQHGYKLEELPKRW